MAVQAGRQLINILSSPYGDNPSNQGPFPAITSDTPCPQYLLVSECIKGAYSITGSAPAVTAINVEYQLGNQKQAGLITTDTTLANINSGF